MKVQENDIRRGSTNMLKPFNPYSSDFYSISRGKECLTHLFWNQHWVIIDEQQVSHSRCFSIRREKLIRPLSALCSTCPVGDNSRGWFFGKSLAGRNEKDKGNFALRGWYVRKTENSTCWLY